MNERMNSLYFLKQKGCGSFIFQFTFHVLFQQINPHFEIQNVNSVDGMRTLLYIVNNKHVEIERGRAIKLLAVSSRSAAESCSFVC